MNQFAENKNGKELPREAKVPAEALRGVDGAAGEGPECHLRRVVAELWLEGPGAGRGEGEGEGALAVGFVGVGVGDVAEAAVLCDVCGEAERDCFEDS